VTRHYLDHASTSPLRPESAAAIDGIESHVHPVERLPHLVCASITDIEPQAVLDALPTILADLRFLR
jgi:hypothetical protein